MKSTTDYGNEQFTTFDGKKATQVEYLGDPLTNNSIIERLREESGLFSQTGEQNDFQVHSL